MEKTRVLVTGSAGFLGGHLCHYLRGQGYRVRAVDWVEPRYGDVDCDEADWDCDLRYWSEADLAVEDMQEVYALAADMGGAGFVFTGINDLEIMRNNVLININTLEAARRAGIKRYLFTSSACVYPDSLQALVKAILLKEEKVYPAMPGSEYGWEKLYTERLCQVYNKATDMQIAIARQHNVYGPLGAWKGGREKLPAAACRKVAMAKLTGKSEIEIWGDGEQTRSFCYVDDCIEMLYLLMHSNFTQPLNIGTDRPFSVNEVFDVVASIAGIEIEKHYDLSKPQGPRGRNADLTLMRQVLGYEPQVSLEEGLRQTYLWVEGQVQNEMHHSQTPVPEFF